MPLSSFHPAVATWFARAFPLGPTEPQRLAWPSIQTGQPTLIAAPTGSGKTLAAFLAALDALCREATGGVLEDATAVVYVSPLKALSNDIRKNLEEPLAGIAAAAAELGLPVPEIRTAVRTGDTPAKERTAMLRRPPHILVTTPESLYILLTSAGGRRVLKTAKTVIVDEIHAVVGDKRGAHLALSLERLTALCVEEGSGAPQRIGLSATQKPIAEVARFLVGVGVENAEELPAVVAAGPRAGRAPAATSIRTAPRIDAANQPERDPVEEPPGDPIVPIKAPTRAPVDPPIAPIDAPPGEPADPVSDPPVGPPEGPPDGPIAGRFRFADPAARVAIIDTGHRRALDLGIEIPGSPLEAVMPAEVWEEVYDRVAELAREHRSTLVFVNTRRLAERVAHHLAQRLGDDVVAAHHGSLSRERRLDAETRLKSGALRVLVATASLELGIDIGSVDLVCQLGSTRRISALLQRVGRSGHRLSDVPKGRLFPLSRDELIECVALLDAVRRGDLETLIIPEKPLDILAQQIVAETAARDWDEDALYAMLRRAWPYRNLERSEFDEVVVMLAEGFTSRRGRRAAYLHRDGVHGRVRARRGARLAAITSGGAIPDAGDFRVIQEPSSIFVGTINEDFAIESLPGDIFQLGNTSWRIAKIEPGRVLVEDARGQPPTLPFWLGEAPERSAELSRAVCRVRTEIDERLRRATPEGTDAPDASDDSGAIGPELRRQVTDSVAADHGLSLAAASQVVEYLAATAAALGTMPTQATLVLERFFDEAGDTHIVLHAPFGSRMNRALGLALRKRFCRNFNFELQAAATEDAILFSLGPTHSFPLADVFRFLHSATVREILVQALLDAPVFGVRWRWNASRSLALLRFRSGRRVPPRLQRQEADDLSAVVFPDHLACPENLAGEREIPDHPLVRQTIHDCLTEAMDIDGVEALLRAMESGALALVARELTEPSPLAHEIVNARVYAFLDDAPLEERRTQAVQARRFLSPEDAAGLGALDGAAIAAVREEAWPTVENAEELHDAIATYGFLTVEELQRWRPEADSWIDELDQAQRLLFGGGHGGVPRFCVAAERQHELRAIVAEDLPVLFDAMAAPPEPHDAWVAILRSRLELLGPVTARELAAPLGGNRHHGAVEAALAALEVQGFAFRGQFTPRLAPAAAPATEWCARSLLARIHRRTLDRLRGEIEPVSKADYTRFLSSWQRVLPAERARGPEGLAAILDQLEGFEAPAAAWESEILPARVVEYDPAWLDALCLAGRYSWLRLTPPEASGRRAGPLRTSPIALVRRENLALWQEVGQRGLARTATAAQPSRGPAPAAAANTAATADELSGPAAAVQAHLRSRGASFFAEIAAGTRLLPSQLEAALAELVTRGAVTSDSVTGLRALLVPSRRRAALVTASERSGRPPRLDPRQGMECAGRWALLPAAGTAEVDGGIDHPGQPAPPPIPRWQRDEETAETIVRVLLRRYGVVCRRLLDGEGRLPPWRDLIAVLRRLEARGEVRGGRFLSGVSGEQYALPDAVTRLRSIRRHARVRDAGDEGHLLSLSAVDPLNLPGLLPTDARVATLTGNRVLYRDGEPLAVLEAGTPRMLRELDPADAWQAELAMRRRGATPGANARFGRGRSLGKTA